MYYYSLVPVLKNYACGQQCLRTEKNDLYDQSFVPVITNSIYDQRFISTGMNFASKIKSVSTYKKTQITSLSYYPIFIELYTRILDIYTRSVLITLALTRTLTLRKSKYVSIIGYFIYRGL